MCHATVHFLALRYSLCTYVHVCLIYVKSLKCLHKEYSYSLNVLSDAHQEEKKNSALKFGMKSQRSTDPLLSPDANDTLSGVLEYRHSEDQAIRGKFSILKNRLITESGIVSNVSSGMLVFKLPFGRLLWLHPHQPCDSER